MHIRKLLFFGLEKYQVPRTSWGQKKKPKDCVYRGTSYFLRQKKKAQRLRIQGSFAGTQGSFADTHSSFGNTSIFLGPLVIVEVCIYKRALDFRIQGSFVDIQGSFTDTQGSFTDMCCILYCSGLPYTHVHTHT